MTIGEYLTRFQASLRRLEQTKTKRALGVALDTLALTKRRVQGSGLNSEGAFFAPYSTLYAAQRIKDGYQSNYVDFTRTGRLWNSINPFVYRDEQYRTVIVVRPRDNENQDKLNKQAALKNRGNILTPSSDELTFAIQVWEREAISLLNRIR